MKIAKYLLYIFLSWFIIHTVAISIDGIFNKEHVADIAIVLGNKVNEDGTLSPRLKARLDKAKELYTKSLVRKIIVSGGLGKEGFYEAEKMKTYLTENNIPDSSIIVDNRGDNTALTVGNAYRMQQVLKYNSITVVSQFYHISRTKLLFHKTGIKEVYGASPSYYEFRDLYSLVREFFGYYYALLFVSKEEMINPR
jgi:vancomycin permeability regulator SanA